MGINPSANPSQRPVAFEDLLREPILATLPSNGALVGACYQNWDTDHGERVRFYLSGYLGFLRTGVVKDTKELFSAHSKDAISNIPGNWKSVFGRDKVWDEVSSNQFRAARNGTAVYCQKTALVLLAAELAVDHALSAGRTVGSFTSGADVYQQLKIVPACYNIDGFNRDFLGRLNDAQIADIAAKSGQPVAVLHDLAGQHTVTATTALNVLNAAAPHGQIGPVRGKPGRNLGTKKASENEVLDLG